MFVEQPQAAGVPWPRKAPARSIEHRLVLAGREPEVLAHGAEAAGAIGDRQAAARGAARALPCPSATLIELSVG